MPPATTSCEIYHGNAVAVMHGLPTGSIDSAVFDPPYAVISGGSNDKPGSKHQRPSGILTKNDGKIFKHNDIKASEYLPEVYRVLREDAHMYMMTNTHTVIDHDVFGDLRKAGFQIHNFLFWRKNNATPNGWYMKDTELVIFCRKGRAFRINNPGDRSTQTVFPHRLDWNNVPSPKSHPTEKPVNLMLSYIRNSTFPGDRVLDPFCGTGSTGVAAREAGCGFIGIDMDPEYSRLAATRLSTEITRTDSDAEIDALLA